MGNSSVFLATKGLVVASLRKVGVRAHPYRPTTLPVAEKIADSLQSEGVESWVFTEISEAMERDLENADLIVAIGGDGSMLRTARACAPHQVPIFGINTGYLGFLTEISPDDWMGALPRLLAGDYWIEDRMMIKSDIFRNGECIATEHALNDIVISRGSVARSIHLEAFIDEAWTTTYHADGLIVSTATGSTAYALAVGGPILPPELKNIMMIAVAPHLSIDRPLVLSQGAAIKVTVAPHTFDPEVVVTVDGILVGNISIGDYVLARASERTSRFVRLRERGYFFRSLLDRLEPRLVVRPQH